MLSEGLKSRDSLKPLIFNRSISEPGHSRGMPMSMAPLVSPPSLTPSIHPPKRPKIEIRSKPNLSNGFLCPPPGVVSLPNSPCSESSTLQRTLVMKQAGTITGDSLAKRLQKGSKHGRNFLLLDCRPFIAYNVSHIKGAINVNCCDRFNRKRLQQGKASLADLATTKEGKEMLKKRNWKEVVVYDECSEDLSSLPFSHTLFLVINSLVEDLRQPIMLIGGLRCFQTTQSSLCEDHLMRTPIGGSLTIPGLPAPPSPTDIPFTKDIENHPASQVTPFLFLGNMKDASDIEALSRLGIDHVLNVTAVSPTYQMSSKITYKQLPAADNGYQNLKQYFDEAFEFIDKAKNCGGSVLIHCQAGVSRTPTIAVAYLIKYFTMTMVDAYKFVKSRRSIISPNLNFMGQLLEFEQGIKASRRSEKQVSEISSVNSYKSLGENCWDKPLGETQDKPSWSDTKTPEVSPGCSV